MKEPNFEFYACARRQEKDVTNLMELLKKQSEDSKPILYLGRNEKKVILTYDSYQQENLKATCWNIVVKKNVIILTLELCDTVEEYNERIVINEYKLTEEEFNTLKEGLKL